MSFAVLLVTSYYVTKPPAQIAMYFATHYPYSYPYFDPYTYPYP